MGTYGAAALAAHQIAMNAASITFMVPMGIGMASTVRVGLAAGAGDIVAARRAGARGPGHGRPLHGRVAACSWPSSAPRSPASTLDKAARDDAAVIVLASLFLRYAAAFQLFDGLQVVGARVLRGLKDARMPMILAGASYWLIGAPVCVFLAVGLKMKGEGIWLGFVVCLAVAAVAMCARFLRLTKGGAIKLPA